MPDEWFVYEDDRQSGPIPDAEMKARAAAGTLRPETLIFNLSMSQWRPAGEVTDWTFGPPPAVAAPAAAQGGVANPAAPFALSYVSHGGQLPVLSPRVIDILRATRPWLRMFALLGYILGGLMIVAGVLMIVLSSTRTRPGGPPALATFLYILLGMIYFVPATYLSGCASKITQLERMRRTSDLEEALAAQHAFWRFCGVIALVTLGIYIAVMIALALGLR